MFPHSCVCFFPHLEKLFLSKIFFQGFLEAGETIELQVKLIPGTPEPFLKKLRVQVAHFEPHVLEIKGEGVFPRLVLDLPREYKEEEQRAYDQAKKSLKERRSGQSDESKHVMSFLAVDKQDEEAEVFILFIANKTRSIPKHSNCCSLKFQDRSIFLVLV